MIRILKGVTVFFLILTVIFSTVGCMGENVIDNISSDGISSVAGSEEMSSASKSEQSNNDDKSKPSQNTSQISSKTGDKSSTSSKFKRPTTSSKDSSNKTSTSSVYEKDISLYMLDYIFRNKIYADEYYNRGGIYNTLYKLQKGEDITIAYLGGSITEQKTWRVYTTKWFEDNFSGKVNEVEI